MSAHQSHWQCLRCSRQIVSGILYACVAISLSLNAASAADADLSSTENGVFHATPLFTDSSKGSVLLSQKALKEGTKTIDPLMQMTDKLLKSGKPIFVSQNDKKVDDAGGKTASIDSATVASGGTAEAVINGDASKSTGTTGGANQRAGDKATNPAPVNSENAAALGEPVRLVEPPTADIGKTLHLNPVYLSRAIEMRSFDALRNETSLSQLISLREAINYVLDQGMSIKISRESMNYQRYLTASGVAAFLPTFSMSYNLTEANVTNLATTSIGRTFLAGVFFPVFQGGGVMYSLLSQRYREKAWREAYKATVSDVFLDVYQKYTNLLLQRVLLQTWAKTVEADEEQLRISKLQLVKGVGTQYGVLQADAALSADRQSFLQQAVAMRQAGLALNLALNMPLSINLIPVEETLAEAEIFGDGVQLKSLLADTIRYNPGLKQYENFRLAASRNIQAQAASLYPQASFFVLYQLNSANVTPASNGFALGGAATSAITSFLDGTFSGRASNNALGQQYIFSPTAGDTSSQGANTGPSAMPAASGGTPLALVQSGSLVSSGAVAPSIFGGGTGGGSGPNVNGSLQAPSGIFPGYFSEVQAGLSLSWSLPSFGLQTAASLMASKVLARQTLIQCNQEITILAQKVRGDYLAILSARQAIGSAAATAASFKQALTVAQARYRVGAGTQLEVIQAQKGYISALTGQAQSIVTSNVAQAQLLHDMGIISAATLTNGYTPGQFIEPNPTPRRRSTTKP